MTDVTVTSVTSVTSVTLLVSHFSGDRWCQTDVWQAGSKKQHARIDGPASAEPTILGAHLMDVANAIRPRKGRWNYTMLYTSVIISSSVKFQHLLNLLALLPVSSAESLGCSPN